MNNILPYISIICPCYNEEKLINKCIEGILQQDYPHDRYELILVDGGSKDRTCEIIKEYSASDNRIKLLNNPNRTSPYAMNIGINATDGEYIVRIDAHADYPSNYLSTLMQGYLDFPDAANIGVVCKTEARSNTAKARAIAFVLSNRFGVGNSQFRIGVDTTREVDTVPFGCFPRRIFDKVGLYDERFTRNQDIELNSRIRANGGKIYLLKDAYCTYYARDDYKSLMKNNYGNGYWNILTVHYTKQFSTLSVRHFVPLCFVLSIILPIVFSFVSLWTLLISLLSLLAYLSLILTISIKAKLQDKTQSILHIIISFFVLHFSYGIGSLWGILSLPFVKR